MVTHTCNFSTQESGTGGLGVEDHLYETLERGGGQGELRKCFVQSVEAAEAIKVIKVCLLFGTVQAGRVDMTGAVRAWSFRAGCVTVTPWVSPSSLPAEMQIQRDSV